MSSLFCGALWILGLSIAIAAWSYISWWAAAHAVKVQEATALPLFVVPFFAGLVLFCAGMAWSMDPLVLRALWAVAGFGCLWTAARGARAAAGRKSLM